MIISTSRGTALSQSAHVIQLGGTTVYGPSESETLEMIEIVGKIIDACCEMHLSVTRSVLGKLASDKLGEPLEKRLFGALLGSRIRLGHLCVIMCEAETGAEFRVFLHRSKVGPFTAAREIAKRMLRTEQQIMVKALEQKLFGERAYNTWSSTSHVLARLAFQGIALYKDRMTFVAPGELLNAVRSNK